METGEEVAKVPEGVSGMEIESNGQGVNGMELESDQATDVPAEQMPPATDIPAEQMPPATDVPAEQMPPAPDVPAEQMPPAPDIPAEQMPPAPDVPAEQMPPAPDIPAEQMPPATDVPAEHTPPVPDVPAELMPPAPDVPAELMPPAPDVPAEHMPPAPDVPAEQTPPAPDVPVEDKPTDVSMEQLPAEENRLSAEEIKHWAAVKGNPSDFSSWTVLLQLMEQKGKVGPAREVFDAFLKQYPYCYGYWKKYADFERKHSGPDTAKEVFDRGVEAVPLSVDLWVHFACFTVGVHKDRPHAQEEIRSEAISRYPEQVSQRLAHCLLDPLLHVYYAPISLSFLLVKHLYYPGKAHHKPQKQSTLSEEWKESLTPFLPSSSSAFLQVRGSFEKAVSLAAHKIKFLSTKESFSRHLHAHGMSSFYKSAVDACGMDYKSGKIWDMYVAWEQENGASENLLSVFDRLLATPTSSYQQHFEKFKQVVELTPPSQLLSELEYKELCGAVQSELSSEQIAEEGALEKAVREKVVERRIVIHEACKAEVEKRSHFEDGIKRPYFHVKPLEKVQLKNWKEYLEFEIAQGNQQRIITLFERCMIACALYEDFWTKFAKYAEENCPVYAESVYSRACTIHLQQKPNIHIAWAAFEERRGDTEKARGILRAIDSVVPGLVFVRLRRIGLEVRGRCHDRVEALYCESIASAQSTEARNFYAGRYARFAAKVLCDHNKATKILREVIDADSLNPTLYLRLLDIAMSRFPLIETDVEGVFDLVRGSRLSEDVKQAFALRRLQFLEEFGSSISKFLEAQEDFQKLKKSVTVGRKRSAIEGESEEAKRARVDSTSAQDGTMAEDTQQAQQWAAYQQQWSNYNYGQQGYNYQQYYQYPYQQQPQQ